MSNKCTESFQFSALTVKSKMLVPGYHMPDSEKITFPFTRSPGKILNMYWIWVLNINTSFGTIQTNILNATKF